MAKVAIKNENIVPFGGIFYVIDEFKRMGLGTLIDNKLGKRCGSYGFQYSEIVLALFCIYLCGGDHMEDITTVLGNFLRTAPDARVPSSDTLSRGLKELRAPSIAYTSPSGATYMHDPAVRLNSLLLDSALLMGLLEKGQGVDVDFDNEFIPTEKSDAVFSYKKKRGYFPGVATCGPVILGLENRQGNSNVKYEQVEEVTRMIDNIEAHGMSVRMFRADCGSFIKELVEMLCLRSEVFYLRASNCQARAEMYDECDRWRQTKVNGQEMDVASFDFTEFLSDWHLRLVVQRTEKDAQDGERWLPSMGYVYRAILTSDRDSTEEQVIETYNKRGASERNFDMQNNDFGWSHLPFSTMEDNTVFLILTAMLKNFYVYLLLRLGGIFPGIDSTCRVKRFLFAFIVVPAKWVLVARQWTLNIYTKNRWLHYWTVFNQKPK